MSAALEFRELTTDAELADAFSLMSSLRDRIRQETFVSEVRRQHVEGYRLYGGFERGKLLCLAGVRRTHTLARGEHLFIDDLVTVADERGKGHGTAMIRWLAERAAAQGVKRIHLDSRSTARGFYEKAGFVFATSIPCSVDVDDPSLRAGKAAERESAPGSGK